MKQSVLFSVFLLLASPMQARDIDVDEALSKGQEFFNNAGSWYALGRDIERRQQPLSLAYTAAGADASDFYVFNREGGGYVLVAAYDGAEEILGYSETGTFDCNNIPDGLKSLLGTYTEQIDFARQNGLSTETRATSDKKDIEPMIQTKWTQNEPYNQCCPIVSGSRALVGCVPIAMAQVMKYHQWPSKGKGYVQAYDNDLSKHSYDWANMAVSYTSSQKNEAKNLAQLLYDCGTTVGAEYSPDGTGAPSAYASQALVSYFDYDSTASYTIRKLYSDSEWTDLVYSELKNGRPVMYSATDDKSGGHLFICDGYRKSDDMYHMNFGWGGYCDDYYKLDAMILPNIVEFSSNHEIIYGLKKNENTAVVPRLGLTLMGDLLIKDLTPANKCKTFRIECDDSFGEDNYVLSYTCADVDIQFAMKYRKSGSDEVVYSVPPFDYNHFEISSFMCFTSVWIQDVNEPQLSEGTYEMTPVYRLSRYADAADDQYWQEIRAFNRFRNYTEILVIAPSNVSDIESDENEGRGWMLDGRVGIGLGKGVYIKNGKKYWSAD